MFEIKKQPGHRRRNHGNYTTTLLAGRTPFAAPDIVLTMMAQNFQAMGLKIERSVAFRSGRTVWMNSASSPDQLTT